MQEQRVLQASLPILKLNNPLLTDHDIEALIPATLQSADIQNCAKISDKTLQVLALKTHLRSLRWIANPAATTSGHLFLAHHANLHMLNVSGCQQFTNEACQKHLQSETLKTLDVSFCPLLTDEAFAQIQAPLTYLNLQGCSQITDQTIYRLSLLPTLKHLFLAFNEKLTKKSLSFLKSLPLQTLKIYPLDI